MKPLKKIWLFVSIITLLCASCKKREALPPHINQPPVAIAGPNQKIYLPVDSVELRGIGLDSDGMIVSFEWTKTTGPLQYAFVNNSNAVTEVKNLLEGVYEFELKVTDDVGFPQAIGCLSL